MMFAVLAIGGLVLGLAVTWVRVANERVFIED